MGAAGGDLALCLHTLFLALRLCLHSTSSYLSFGDAREWLKTRRDDSRNVTAYFPCDVWRHSRVLMTVPGHGGCRRWGLPRLEAAEEEAAACMVKQSEAEEAAAAAAAHTRTRGMVRGVVRASEVIFLFLTVTTARRRRGLVTAPPPTGEASPICCVCGCQ